MILKFKKYFLSLKIYFKYFDFYNLKDNNILIIPNLYTITLQLPILLSKLI